MSVRLSHTLARRDSAMHGGWYPVESVGISDPAMDHPNSNCSYIAAVAANDEP